MTLATAIRELKVRPGWSFDVTDRPWNREYEICFWSESGDMKFIRVPYRSANFMDSVVIGQIYREMVKNGVDRDAPQREKAESLERLPRAVVGIGKELGA